MEVVSVQKHICNFDEHISDLLNLKYVHFAYVAHKVTAKLGTLSVSVSHCQFYFSQYQNFLAFCDDPQPGMSTASDIALCPHFPYTKVKPIKMEQKSSSFFFILLPLLNQEADGLAMYSFPYTVSWSIISLSQASFFFQFSYHTIGVLASIIHIMLLPLQRCEVNNKLSLRDTCHVFAESAGRRRLSRAASKTIWLLQIVHVARLLPNNLVPSR